MSKTLIGNTDKDIYVQCLLEHINVMQTCYIPEKFAKLGEILKIKTNGVWKDGWEVTEVGTSIAGIPDIRKSIRGHRKNTGDSIKKEK